LLGTVSSYWLFAYKNSLLVAYQRLDVQNIISFFVTTIQYVLQILVIVVFENFYLYAIIGLIVQILNNIITSIVVSAIFPKCKPNGVIETEEINKIKCRIKDIFTARLGGVVVNYVDTVVISAFLGLSMLGIYNNYYYIMKIVITFISIFFSACVAGIGNSLVADSVEKNYNDFRVVTFIIRWISGVCACCLITLYQPFMKYWLGNNYLLDDVCVILFCIYFYVYVNNNVFTMYKDAAGIWHEDRYRPLIGAGFNLITNLLFVHNYGIYAILVSTILCYVCITMPWLIYNLFKVLFKRSCQQYLKQMVRDVVCTILIVGICIVTTKHIKCDKLDDIFIKGIFCFFISNVCFWWVYHKSEEFKRCMQIKDQLLYRKGL